MRMEVSVQRAFILTDLEGVAGVVSFETQTVPAGAYYDEAKRLLTGEVNAAVEALLDSGVDDVLVCDGHGAGGIAYTELHPAARLLHGRPITVSQLFAPLQSYDAALVIGQHAQAGAPAGNMNHTQDSTAIDFIRLNGRPIGEIAQFALYAGSLGVPVIFLSGDTAACREAEELLPRAITVSVKEGLGRGAAISLSAPEARRRIREGVGAAVRRHRERPVEPAAWPGPYVLEKRFFMTDRADAAAELPGAIRVDAQTVRFESRQVRDVIYR
jgi:D-amino peptidase